MWGGPRSCGTMPCAGRGAVGLAGEEPFSGGPAQQAGQLAGERERGRVAAGLQLPSTQPPVAPADGPVQVVVAARGHDLRDTMAVGEVHRAAVERQETVAERLLDYQAGEVSGHGVKVVAQGPVGEQGAQPLEARPRRFRHIRGKRSAGPPAGRRRAAGFCVGEVTPAGQFGVTVRHIAVALTAGGPRPTTSQEAGRGGRSISAYGRRSYAVAKFVWRAHSWAIGAVAWCELATRE